MTAIPPLIPIAVAWLFGLWLGLAAGPTRLPMMAAALLAAASAACGTAHRPAARLWLWRMLPLLSGLAGWLAGMGQGPAPPIPAGLARVEARVEQASVGAAGVASARIRVVRGERVADGSPVPAGARLRFGPHGVPAGGLIRTLAVLRPLTPFRNPSPHPAWPQPHLDGFAFAPSPSATRVLALGPLDGAVAALRARLRRALAHTLRADHAAMARALLLGERAAVPDAVLEQVTNAGLVHALAVSGLHISLLAGMLLLALRHALARIGWLARRYATDRIALAAAALGALVLARVCGAGPSALRAGTTAALAWGALALGRRPSLGAVTAGAVVIVSALDPAEASHVGLVLSVLATAAIVSGIPGSAAPTMSASTVWAAFHTALRINLRTTLATAPVVLWCFGQVPLWGLAANLVGVPLMATAVLPACALHAGLALAWTPLARLSAPIVGLAIDGFVGLCASVADWPLRLAPPPLTFAQGLFVAAACLIALVPARVRMRAAGLAVCLLALGFEEARVRRAEQPTDQLRITFLDVGQGDAALVDLPDGRLMLVDAGGAPGGGRDPGEAVLAPLLLARRRERVDIAVLSHPHPDHYGGLPAVAAQLPIDTLWDNGQAEAESDFTDTHAAAAALLAQLRGRGTRVIGPAALCDRPHSIGGATVEILWPCPGPDSGHSANDNSLVLRLRYGAFTALFSGDVEAHAEAVLARSDRVRADVLKVPHHGSRTSSSHAFLSAVAPRLAVISAGLHNRFGHPHAEAHSRLAATGARIIELARAGGTVIESDGHGAAVRTWSGERFRLSLATPVAPPSP